MKIADGDDFKFLAEQSVDIVCRSSLDRVLTYVSPTSLSVLGWKPDEMTDKLVDDFILSEDLPILSAAIASQHDTATVRMFRPDGSTTWMENRARLVRDAVTGEPAGWVVTMRDISVRMALEEELLSQALTDSLTGIANRRAFDAAMAREWKRTLREGSQISLLLLDIDHFKEFNDRYGHQVGDDCLRTVASAVSGAVRTTDLVARYGGEEIAVILPCTLICGAVEVAEKVRSAVESLRFPHESNAEAGGWLTVSIGAATALARHGGTMRMPENLLLAADNALYKAKQNGRNRVATALLVAEEGG